MLQTRSSLPSTGSSSACPTARDARPSALVFARLDFPPELNPSFFPPSPFPLSHSFRHVYARLRPNVDDRFHSYEASCELFNFLLNSEGPVQLELPSQWLWDILDEFIWQFQSFGQWRSDWKSKSEEELSLLAEGSQVRAGT